MSPLFETIIDYIPAPEGDPEAPTQMLISTIDYNEYVGRIGVGKVDNGAIKVNQECVMVNHHDPDKFRKVKIGKLYEFEGLNRVEVTEAGIGAIVAISGISGHPHRRYSVLPGEPGGHSVPEDFRAHHRHAFHGKRQPPGGTGGKIHHLPPHP